MCIEQEEAGQEEQEKLLYTVYDVAKLLQISVDQVQRVTKAGDLGCVCISRSVIRYSKRQIDEFIKSKTVECTQHSEK